MTTGENEAINKPKLHYGSSRRRLQIIRQTENAECGLACVAMIANYFGHEISLPELRQRFPLSQRGATLKQIIDVSQELNLSCRPLRIELHELDRLSLPCILHWNMSHFVVLTKFNKGRLVINDPAMGKRHVTIAEANDRFSGVALELTAGPKFQRKLAPPAISLRTLAGSIQGLGRSLSQIFGLAILLELIAILTPQFIAVVVDQVLAGNDRDLLIVLGSTFMVLLGFQVGVTALRTWIVMWLSTQFNLNWTGNVYQHLLRLPLPYFVTRGLGDIVSRFSAITVIQQTITTQFIGVLVDGVMATLTLVMIFLYSPILTLITATTVGIYASLRVLYFRVYRDSNLSQIVVDAKQQTRLLESIRGIQTLRLYNQVAHQTSRYLNITADAINTSIRVQRLSLVFDSLGSLSSGLRRVGTLWLGAWLALNGRMSAGMLMAYLSYAEQFSGRAISLTNYLVQLKLLRLQGERLADIVLTPPEPFLDGEFVGSILKPDIRLEDVCFRYSDGDPWILYRCSCEIRSGEAVAIIGPSGSGKSTLAKIILGLLEPREGGVVVDHVNLRTLGKRRYRGLCASVMQDDCLFEGSIAENIAFFDHAATLNEIEAAALSAGIHEEIARLPMGFHTPIGDMGSTLSGGQRQRILLARALYTKPSILILDEATSSLDVARERLICDQLDAMKITRIIIAHRLETIMNADRILLLQSGQLLELSAEQREQLFDKRRAATV